MQVLKSPNQVVIKVALFLVTLPVFQVDCAKICIFSVVGFMNYRSAYDNLLEGLVDKGHELTVFSTLPLNVGKEYEGKIKYINPQSVTSHLEKFFDYVSPLEWRRDGKQHVLWDMLPILTIDICSIILQDEQTHKWIHNEKRYDLFIVDSAWNECGIALSHVFHAKLILFSWHSNLLTWNLEAFGATSEIATVPDPQYSSTKESNFPIGLLRRFYFTIRSLRWHIYRNSFSFFQVRKFCVKYLGAFGKEEFPGIGEIEENASVVLVNSHWIEEYARALPQVFVQVGGVHIRDPDQIRESGAGVLAKVKNFLGKASKGVVLVNLGCSKDTVRNLREDVKEGIVGAMRKSRELASFVFIWPGKKDTLESRNFLGNVSENVFVIDECTPALNSILAHGQLKAFVTHGDLLDVQEAIYHAVPLIVLPVAFEQDANAERIERMGRGLRLEITTLKEDELAEAIHEIITDSIYKRNMRTASRIFKRGQVEPLDSTLWWVDNTLQSSAADDATYIKSLGIKENWFSRRSIDIWLLIFFCLISCITLVICLIFSRMLSKAALLKKESVKKSK